MERPEPERISWLGVFVYCACVILGFAGVATSLVHWIPGTLVGWFGRVLSLLVAVVMVSLFAALALPGVETVWYEEGDALSPIPESTRRARWWRLTLGVNLLLALVPTYIWVSDVIGGSWPKDADGYAVGAFIAWMALVFLWFGKVPPIIPGG